MNSKEAQHGKPILGEGFVKKILAKYTKEEISFGKMVELLNEEILISKLMDRKNGLMVGDFENILGSDAVGKSYARECFEMASKAISELEDRLTNSINYGLDVSGKAFDLQSQLEAKEKEAIELIKMLTEGEDIISGIEAQADNMGIDLAEVRHWWVDARKLLDELEGKNSA